jgi:hypothetical protein
VISPNLQHCEKPFARFAYVLNGQVDASSLLFLASHGFDFNVWVRSGVPYVPLELHQELLDKVRKCSAIEGFNWMCSMCC